MCEQCDQIPPGVTETEHEIDLLLHSLAEESRYRTESGLGRRYVPPEEPWSDELVAARLVELAGYPYRRFRTSDNGHRHDLLSYAVDSGWIRLDEAVPVPYEQYGRVLVDLLTTGRLVVEDGEYRTADA